MLKRYLIIILLTLLAFTDAANCQVGFFGVARIPVPVLNSPDFSSVFGGNNGSSMKTDRCGQVRELEFIALSGTVFKILGELKRGTASVYQVETEEYKAPSGIRLYVDSRFLELHNNAPSQRKQSLPAHEQILATLMESIGSPYVWGGNVPSGVPELTHYFYPDFIRLGRKESLLAGLDCSGLLYHATDGSTPRNTSQLISYGKPVKIKGNNAEGIARLLEPLDLIVWKGHVIIVLDRETVIESRLECGKSGNGGVVTTPLWLRLREILRTRKAADSWPTTGKQRDVFVIRRWF
jgi:hypothetical protein